MNLGIYDEILFRITSVFYTKFKTAVAYTGIGFLLGITAMYFGG